MQLPGSHFGFCCLCSRALSRVGLVGPLSAALGDLKKLRTVDLSFNQLTGSLPEEWGSSQSLPAVRELLLTSNQLSGSLPPAWGGPSRFADLASLQLGTNKLSGGLPATWAASGMALPLPACDDRHPKPIPPPKQTHDG